jgi:minor histocompatibility antigen H13
MVMVAKKLDLPIKIIFPYLNSEGVEKFSLLGLGDIVIPGIYVAFCLKYDVDKCIGRKVKNVEEFQLRYFRIAYWGYVGGICLTFLVLWVFDVPQPALLFIVPCCTLPVLGYSVAQK